MKTRYSVWVCIAALCCVSTVVGQTRPWTFANSTIPGANATIQNAGSALFHLGDSVLKSFDFGAQWETVVDVVGAGLSASSYINNSTVLATWKADQNIARHYFSSTNSSWELFDSLSPTSEPIAAVTSGINVITVCKQGAVYVRGQQLDSLAIPLQNVISAAATESQIVVANQQTAVSIETATNTITPVALPTDAGEIQQVVSSNERMFVLTSRAVFRINQDATAEIIAPESGAIGPLSNMGFAASNLYVLGMAETPVGKRRQLYRFGTTDTVWVAIGDTIPGTNFRTTRNILAFDATRAIVSNTPSIDSLKGVYTYDVNDFTSVLDSSHTKPIQAVPQRVEVYSLTGMLVSEYVPQESMPTPQRALKAMPAAPQLAPGLYIVVTMTSTANGVVRTSALVAR
jgi:hypothetical protein